MADPKEDPELTRDSDAFLDEAGTPSQSGRAGGSIARAIASEDEEKRAESPDAGVTRVRKADEEKAGTSNLGTENR